MITLGKRIMLGYIGISLVTVLIITVLSNIGIRYYFNDYVLKQSHKSDKEIESYVHNSIENDGLLDTRELAYLKQQARFKNVEIYLLNQDEEMVFNSNMGMGMNSGMGHGNMQGSAYRAEYKYKTQPLYAEGQLVGYLVIGHSKSLIANRADSDFIYTINGMYVIAFLIAVVFAILLSLMLTKRLTKPIIAIKNSTYLIAGGNYESVQEIKTDTIELRELARSVEELARQLNEQEQLRKRLSNDISHELRSPIAVLRSQIEAMMDGVMEPSISRLAKLHDEILRITKLINDLNELVIVEGEHLVLDRTKLNLSEVITVVLDNFEPMLATKDIVLRRDIQESVYMVGDKDRLKQILTNLLSNAYKYTDNHGKVIVSLKETKQGIQISIQDTGIGIAQDELAYIFGRFYRSDSSRSRETGGAGIGLSIVKELVKVHHGTITVESTLGEGSLFTLKFEKC